MIIVVTGGIGQGKTLSVVKDLIERNNKAFTNFDLFNTPFTRLKRDHLMIEDPEDKRKMKLNFDFWKEQTKLGSYDIYLDEFHNVMNARRAMSKGNVLLSDWLSQIRKILGQSERNHLYLLTQKLRRIDVNSRDLAHLAIKCEKQEYKKIEIPTEIYEDGQIKIKAMPMVIIYKHFFRDCDALNAYEQYGINTKLMTTRFVGNWYYKYFDSYELIDFSTSEYI